MFFANTKEAIYSTRVNLGYQLIDNKTHKLELKGGLFIQLRNRDFQARQLGYTKYGGSGSAINFNNNLLYLPEDSIFNNANMGLISPGVGGFKLTDGTKLSDSYNANSQLYAAYVKAWVEGKLRDFLGKKSFGLGSDTSKVIIHQDFLDFDISVPHLNYQRLVFQAEHVCRPLEVPP